MEVTFPNQDAAGSHIVVSERSMTITVNRVNTEGMVVVPVEVIDPEGVFTADDIVFNDGQSTTTFDVNFPEIETGKTYECTVQITDPQYARVYGLGATSLTFDVLAAAYFTKDSGEPADFTLTQGWWGEVHHANLAYYDSGEGYRICFLISNEPNGIWGDDVNTSLTFYWYTEDDGELKHTNADGFEFVEVPANYIGFDYSDWASKPEATATNPIYCYDWYNWRAVNYGSSYVSEMGGSFLAWANEKGNADYFKPVSYFDNTANTFYFNMRYFIPGVGGWTPAAYDFTAAAE